MPVQGISQSQAFVRFEYWLRRKLNPSRCLKFTSSNKIEKLGRVTDLCYHTGQRDTRLNFGVTDLTPAMPAVLSRNGVRPQLKGCRSRFEVGPACFAGGRCLRA